MTEEWKMAVFIISKMTSGISFCMLTDKKALLLASGKFPTMAACKEKIAVLKDISGEIEDATEPVYIELPPPKYQIQQNAAGEYYFRVVDKDEQALALSCPFIKKAECVKAIRYLSRNAPNAAIHIRK